jgi:hypothetical protein
MISGIDLNATINYSLKDDTENPTIFKLGIIPSFLLGQISASVRDGKNEIETTYKLLQLGIKGWDNSSMEFKTIEQEMFGRKVKIVPMELLDMLSLKDITELSMKVLEINKLTPEERKN